jgi:hypothetical protein
MVPHPNAVADRAKPLSIADGEIFLAAFALIFAETAPICKFLQISLRLISS